MAIAGSILAVLGTLLTWGFALWCRWAKRQDDPQTQFEKRTHEDDAAIAKGEAGVDDINRRLADLDLRLPDPAGRGPAAG